MLSFEQFANLDESDIYSILDKYGSQDMISAIINEYPDYYNLRGEDLENISSLKNQEVMKILEKEM